MCQLASEAAAVEILFRCERALHFIFEQPASSWAFKLPTMELLKTLGAMPRGPLMSRCLENGKVGNGSDQMYIGTMVDIQSRLIKDDSSGFVNFYHGS